jgi:hypothetical protein
MTATVTHRIANGKLVEKWSNKDVLGFLGSSANWSRPNSSRMSQHGGGLQLGFLPFAVIS